MSITGKHDQKEPPGKAFAAALSSGASPGRSVLFTCRGVCFSFFCCGRIHSFLTGLNWIKNMRLWAAVSSDPIIVLMFCVMLDHADQALLPGVYRVLEIDFGIEPKTISLLLFCQMILESASTLVWGHFADSQPYLRLLCWASAAWGVLTVLASFSTSIMTLFVFRILTAVCLASIRPLVQAVVVTSAPVKERGRVFAKVGFVGHVGGSRECFKFISECKIKII